MRQTYLGCLLHPGSASETHVELRNATQVYKRPKSNGGAQPLTLTGAWQFRPKPDRVSVRYAKVVMGRGRNGAGWVGQTQPSMTKTGQTHGCNEAQNTVRPIGY
jgi:hypothetical protein